MNDLSGKVSEGQDYPLGLPPARWLNGAKSSRSDFREPLLPQDSISAARALKPENNDNAGSERSHQNGHAAHFFVR
jgi:hypothetical protein